MDSWAVFYFNQCEDLAGESRDCLITRCYYKTLYLNYFATILCRYVLANVLRVKKNIKKILIFTLIVIDLSCDQKSLRTYYFQFLSNKPLSTPLEQTSFNSCLTKQYSIPCRTSRSPSSNLKT